MKAKKTEQKTFTLDELTDKYIGGKGTPERERFEYELKTDIIGDIIKQTRIERHMTQEQLGELIGVQKAQISKIENNTKDDTRRLNIINFATKIKSAESAR